MNILETALFKLAQEGKISLEQAKILKAIHENRAVTQNTLAEKTGESLVSLTPELVDLETRGIVKEKSGIYYSPDFSEQISELIRKEQKQELTAIARTR